MGRTVKLASVASVCMLGLAACGNGETTTTSASTPVADATSQPTPTTPTATPTAPNIIYILADDLGVGDIGAYGQTKIKTPHLDALAETGMVFDAHYAGSTVCAPSRAVLMTGQHTGNTFIRGNREYGTFLDEEEFGQEPLPEGTVTIASMLNDAGYATGGFGKWGMGVVDTEGAPFKHGFDLFFGYYDQKQAHNYYPTHLWRNEERVALDQDFIHPHPKFEDRSAVPLDAYQDYMGTDYAPYRIVAEAESFIRDNADEPFFIYMPFVVPHAALQIPDEEIERFGYADAFEETPHIPGRYTPHPKPRAARAAMISRMDADVGQLVAVLEELGIRDNTVIMFASDNGPGKEGGADLPFFDSAAGLRGEKRDLYEGGIRSPLIVNWPGHVAPGIRTDHISAFWDVMPTLADIAGLETPPTTDGISFAPTLLGSGEQENHETLYWEFTESKPAQAVRMGDWKAVRRYRKQGRGENRTLTARDVELYNLAEDPSETTNLADQHPEIVAQMVTVMDAREPSTVDVWNFE